MSLSLTLPAGRSPRLHRPLGVEAAFDGLDLPEILFKIGGFLGVAGLLTGAALYGLGSLTLFWVKLLPIPTCSGGALLCLGVLVLCARELRHPSRTLNFQTRERNPV